MFRHNLNTRLRRSGNRHGRLSASGLAGTFVNRIAWVEYIAFGALSALALGLIFDREAPILELSGFSITTGEALLFAAVGLWLLARLVTAFVPARQASAQAYHPHLPRELALPAIIWFVVLLAAALAAPSHLGSALRFSVKVIAAGLAGWAVFDLAFSEARWRLLAQALAASGFVVTLLGLAEAASLAPVTAWLSTFRYEEVVYFVDIRRVSATLVHPNVAAKVLELTLPLALAWTLTARRWWVRVLTTVGLAAELLVLVLTLSRGGLAACALSFGVMAAVAAWYRRTLVSHSSLVTIGMLVVWVVVTLAVNPLLAVRMVSEGSDELWYRASYRVPYRLAARPGEMLDVPVRLTNTGLRDWEAAGSKPFNLSYHLIRLDAPADDYVTYSGLRTSLPADVPRETTVGVTAQLAAPAEPGEYAVEWDMIQESVAWFSKKGAPPERTYLTVAGEAVPGTEVSGSVPSDEAPVDHPSRVKLWMTAVRMARARPLLGVGPANFRWNYESYTGEALWIPHAHSLYFEWLADTGILGFLAFTWISWSLLRVAWRGCHLIQRGEGTLWVWWLALVSGLSAWFAHGAIDFPYSAVPTYTAFWFISGLVVRVAERVPLAGDATAEQMIGSA